MKRRIILIILIVLIATGGGLWWYASSNLQPSSSQSGVFASGFIEATDVAIAPEVAGRIVCIAVAEGDEAKAGIPLVRLDDSLQQAQLRQAETAVATAQAVVEQAQAAVEQAQVGLEQVMASLNQAVVNRDGAEKVWKDALDVQSDPLELEARIIAAQGELDMAELEIELAEGESEQRIAELRRDIAQEILENLEDIEDNPQEINAAVDAAYDTAAAAVEVADRVVGVAQTQVAAAQRQVVVAQRQVEQAQSSVEIIKVQLSKTILSSPVSGVVSARNAEPGEMAQPGVSIITIVELEEVTLTVYVPESKIGLVRLGQKVNVSVDSYPDDIFSGEVVYISPEAQFTPKNIQLKEEREKTVFPVKIRLPNPEWKLKPGMPADAQILVTSSIP